MNLVDAVNSDIYRDRLVTRRYYDHLFEYFCHYGFKKVYFIKVLENGRVRPFTINSIEMCYLKYGCSERHNKKPFIDGLLHRKKYDNIYYNNKILRGGYKIGVSLLDTNAVADLRCCDVFAKEFRVYLDKECTMEVYL